MASGNKKNKRPKDSATVTYVKQVIKDELNHNSEKTRRFTVICWELMTLAVLHNKLDFDQEQLREYLKYMELYGTLISDDALNIQEVYDDLKENGALTLTKEELMELDPSIGDYLDLDAE